MTGADKAMTTEVAGIFCVGSHSKPMRAAAVLRGRALCRRHLNRELLDERIEAWRKDEVQPCPTHPERELRVTRWFGQNKPMVHCTAPLGEKSNYGASGRGRTYRPAGSAYTEFCGYSAEVPQDVLDAGKCEMEPAVARRSDRLCGKTDGVEAYSVTHRDGSVKRMNICQYCVPLVSPANLRRNVGDSECS